MDVQNACHFEDTFSRVSNNNMAEAQNMYSFICLIVNANELQFAVNYFMEFCIEIGPKDLCKFYRKYF
jgi:hypothetical protein